MAIIIANENGDWWGWTKDGKNGKVATTTKLFILDTEKITDPRALAHIAEWAGIDLDYDENDELIIPADIHAQIDESILTDSDSQEDLAYDYGVERTIEI